MDHHKPPGGLPVADSLRERLQRGRAGLGSKLQIVQRDDSKAWRDRRAQSVTHSPIARDRLFAAGLLALKAQADGKPFSIELPTHDGKPRTLSADDVFAELAQVAAGRPHG